MAEPPMRTILPREKYKEPQQRSNFYKQVLQRVAHLPGVVSAGYSTSVPLSWKELTPAIRSDEFTVRNLAERLKSLKRDTWQAIRR